MAAWPTATVGELAVRSVETESVVLRTKMDGGPAKLRRRFSNSVTKVPVGRMVLTKTALDALETFYITTTSGGVDIFTHTHPISGTTVNYRFVTRPEYDLLVSAPLVANRKWTTSFDLEIVPA